MKRYTTTEYGKQNMFAHEPQVEVLDVDYWTNSLEQLYQVYSKRLSRRSLTPPAIAGHFLSLIQSNERSLKQ